MSRSVLSSLPWLLASAAVFSTHVAAASAPALRFQSNVRGDVRVIGAPLAFDCHSAEPVPPGATVTCTGESATADTAPDIYWRDDLANASVTPTQARTAATLELPSGAKVLYARLYWAALKTGPDADVDAVLDCATCPKSLVLADSTQTLPHPYQSSWVFYQSSADVSAYVAAQGARAYRVTDVDGIPLAGVEVDVAFAGWSLVVAYESPDESLRNLALFDGLTSVDPPAKDVLTKTTVSLDGFLVPEAFDAKLMLFAYEGDADYAGDSMSVNGFRVATYPGHEDNLFSSARTRFGSAVCGAGDVPQLSGRPDSLAGYDLHEVDVSSLLIPGATSALIEAVSVYDKYYLGGFATSITDYSPHFGGMTKTVVDVNGGAALQGDVLEYTITARNTGSDEAIVAVIEDQLDPGLTFVSGSIRIVEGGSVGVKTDGAGDDVAEYVAGTRKVVVRVGAGATPSQGGRVAVGSQIAVKFQARIAVDQGVIRNKAYLRAAGKAGAALKTWGSDADLIQVGEQDTTIQVGACGSDADCPPKAPHCDPTAHVCVPCKSDADCSLPSAPACQPDGSCGECSAANVSLCTPPDSLCNTSVGECAPCYVNADGTSVGCENALEGVVCITSTGGTAHCGCDSDADCGLVHSGRVCDPSSSMCIDGCRGLGGNLCPEGEVCTSTDTSIGACMTPGNAPSDVDPNAGLPVSLEVSHDSGGCACSLPRGGRPLRGAAWLALVAAGLGVLRRRNRRA